MANIIDSYSESNQSGTRNLSTISIKAGQSITGNGSAVGSIQYYMKRVDVSSANAVVSIYAHSGTFGTSSIGTGSALATSDAVNMSVLTTSLQLITFSFTGGNQITLDNGTNYVAVVEYNNSNRIALGTDTTSPTHAGNFVNYQSSTWIATSSEDTCFYVYDNASDSEPDLDVTVSAGIQEIGGVRIV